MQEETITLKEYSKELFVGLWRFVWESKGEIFWFLLPLGFLIYVGLKYFW